MDNNKFEIKATTWIELELMSDADKKQLDLDWQAVEEACKQWDRDRVTRLQAEVDRRTAERQRKWDLEAERANKRLERKANRRQKWVNFKESLRFKGRSPVSFRWIRLRKEQPKLDYWEQIQKERAERDRQIKRSLEISNLWEKIMDVLVPIVFLFIVAFILSLPITLIYVIQIIQLLIKYGI